MINELSENEILDYLMTSDFDEGLTPDEFKFLLLKFRNFYRVASCSISNHKDRMELALREADNVKILTEQKVKNIEEEKMVVEKKYDILINKKLSIMERIKGKIILENEN